ncbi:MAG: SDR family oxidoreductase [Pseudomonadota bacterium]
MTLDFAGRKVLVTGASRGLGEACARAFAQAGAEVIAVARSEESLVRLAADEPAIEPWSYDVLEPGFISKLRALKDLDVLVNNAGFNDPQPIGAVPRELLQQMLAVNVEAVFLASQAVVAGMVQRGRGAIVNMSSQMGHVGSPNRTVYCMTKHAVEGLTKALAVEVAAQGVRVNAVAPTFVETDLTRPMLEEPAFRAFVDRSLPQGRLAAVDDVVEAVLFLASDRAASITGTSLRVDGGWTAQ